MRSHMVWAGLTDTQKRRWIIHLHWNRSVWLFWNYSDISSTVCVRNTPCIQFEDCFLILIADKVNIMWSVPSSIKPVSQTCNLHLIMFCFTLCRLSKIFSVIRLASFAFVIIFSDLLNQIVMYSIRRAI